MNRTRETNHSHKSGDLQDLTRRPYSQCPTKMNGDKSIGVWVHWKEADSLYIRRLHKYIYGALHLHCVLFIMIACSHLDRNSSTPGQNGRHFGRRHFLTNFLEWKWQNSNSNFIEICFHESNWQYAIFSSGNGLAPNKRQAITWTHDGPVHWRIYAALRGDTLIIGWIMNLIWMFSVPDPNVNIIVSYSSTLEATGLGHCR